MELNEVIEVHKCFTIICPLSWQEYMQFKINFDLTTGILFNPD